MMNLTLVKKCLYLIFCLILISISLYQVQDIVYERLIYQKQAQDSVAVSWSGKQSILGPIIVVPYTYEEATSKPVTNPNANQPQTYVTEMRQHKAFQYIIPQDLSIKSNLQTQSKSRGLYSFPVYTTEMQLSGEFDLKDINELDQYSNIVSIGQPYLSFAVSDMRGINNRPELIWNNKTLPFDPGSKMTINKQGLHASLDIKDTSKVVDFSFNVSLRGMNELSFSLAAKQLNVNLDSNWPHPSFNGDFLPIKHDINEDGFAATWAISEFSTNINQMIDECNNGDCYKLLNRTFDVQLNTPVDIYSQTDRSIKYGLLFVLVTFAAFFAFEAIKKWPIHPIQYTLVAFSLVVFFLLLIALSEHVGFGLAYVFATIACVSLLVLYLRTVLRSAKWSYIFGGLITLLFATLYIILNSEDIALILGAGLVFVVLATVMLSTRELDWNEIGISPKNKAPETPKVSSGSSSSNPSIEDPNAETKEKGWWYY